MKPEQLKKIAEAIGLKVRGSTSPRLLNRVVVWDGANIHTREIFNPEENPAQLLECEEYLLSEKCGGWYQLEKNEAGVHILSEREVVSGKTRAEAVMNAMSEAG